MLLGWLSLHKRFAAEKCLHKDKRDLDYLILERIMQLIVKLRSVEHLCTLVYAWMLVRFSGIFQPLKCSSATWRWKSFGPRLRSAADTFSPLMYGPCKHDSVDNGVTKGPGSIKQDGKTEQGPHNKALNQTKMIVFHCISAEKCGK